MGIINLQLGQMGLVYLESVMGLIGGAGLIAAILVWAYHQHAQAIIEEYLADRDNSEE